MCEFASFVLTKNNAYYLENSDSHEDIIQQYNLVDNEVNLVRVELTPPQNKEDILDVNKWGFRVDQDIYPEWTYVKDPVLETQARKALTKRMEEQNIGKIIRGGIGLTQKIGAYGTIIMQDASIGIAGLHGNITGGNDCFARTGDYGTANLGNYSEAISGHYGTAISGLNGKSTVGMHGIAIVGNYGRAIINLYGRVRGGYGATIISSGIIGIIGQDGLKPDVFYVEHNGIFRED